MRDKKRLFIEIVIIKIKFMKNNYKICFELKNKPIKS